MVLNRLPVPPSLFGPEGPKLANITTQRDLGHELAHGVSGSSLIGRRECAIVAALLLNDAILLDEPCNLT